MKEYEGIALQYARDVVAGDIPACQWVRAAAQRQLDDLERFADGTEYLWNPVIVKRGKEVQPVEDVCKFLENLPHIKGQWAGQDLELQPWQIFIVSVVFGWITPEGFRRYRTAYLEVPRKNGKTFLMSGVGLYLLCADDEAGAEVYSAAVKKDQAKIVWDTCRRQVNKTEDLREAFGVEALKHSVFIEKNASMFLPLAADSDSLDGLNIHGGLIDELHAHKSREVFDVIETGTGSRTQSLMFIITTAGTNWAGVCYEQRDYVTKLLSGTAQDESYFGIIYTVDDEDVPNIWTQPELLEKANPNWGVSVLPFDIERLWTKAKQTPSAQNNFLTKRVNVWCNAASSWMDMIKWNACHDDALRLEDFEGEPCFMGADFASKKDLAALCLLFERDGHLYPFLRYYLPEEVCRTTSHDLLQGWWREDRLVATPGEIIDFDFIEQDCDDFKSRFEVSQFGYDPHQATQFAGRMIAKGFPMVEVAQTALQLSEPMKELEARAIAGTLHHNDPVLTWMVSNVTVQEDYKQNIYPRKSGATNANKGGDPTKKIDGVIALLCAMNRYMNPGEDETSVYESRGMRVL